MNNKHSLDFFHTMAQSNPSRKDVKILPKNDHSDVDAEFIMRYASKDSNILDLGSGSGLIINKIYKKVRSITAVEVFPEFTKFIANSENITVINEDIFTYRSNKLYDLITMFGVVQYFSRDEVADMYRNYYKNLCSGGKLIIKNQFGVDDDVVVSGFSNELGRNYYSQYRHLESEKSLLSSIGYKNIQTFDIYPAKFNRWANTHYFAIAADHC